MKKKSEDMILVDRKEHARLMLVEELIELKEENEAEFNEFNSASLKFFKKPLMGLEFEQAEILPQLYREDQVERFDEALDECVSIIVKEDK